MWRSPEVSYPRESRMTATASGDGGSLEGGGPPDARTVEANPLALAETEVGSGLPLDRRGEGASERHSAPGGGGASIYPLRGNG